MRPATDSAPAPLSPRHAQPPRTVRVLWLRAALLLLWAAASFGMGFWAHRLDQVLLGWPLNFWWMAQGGVLVFIGIAMLHAWVLNRHDRLHAHAPHHDLPPDNASTGAAPPPMLASRPPQTPAR